MPALDGQRIVVTRAAHQAEELAGPLRQLGAEVILLPTIAIAPPLDLSPLRAAAQDCNSYDWLIFTSANAIEAFVAQLPHEVAFCRARIATVGAATRAVAERQGFTVSLTPASYVAESLVAAFCPEKMSGLRVLIPSAAVTRDVIAPELHGRGAEVTIVEAYRNILPPEAAEDAPRIFRDPYPHWLTFTSSSAVEHLLRITAIEPLQKSRIATIGPLTSQTVHQHGLRVTVEAAPHSVTGLITALCTFVASGAS